MERPAESVVCPTICHDAGKNFGAGISWRSQHDQMFMHKRGARFSNYITIDIDGTSLIRNKIDANVDEYTTVQNFGVTIYLFIWRIFLFSKDAFNLSKVTKDIYNLIFLFKINAILITFHSLKKKLKLSSTTVFKIDKSKKCFLSTKSAYYYDFWKIMRLKNGIIAAENSALPSQN